MPGNNMLYMSGGTITTMPFPSFEAMMEWQEKMMNIKHRIAAINDMDHTQEERNEMYCDWLAMVHMFRARYGDSFVPWDIRNATNSVEEGCGWPKTVWQLD